MENLPEPAVYVTERDGWNTTLSYQCSVSGMAWSPGTLIRLVVAVCRRKETVTGVTRAGSYAAQPLGAAHTLTTKGTGAQRPKRPLPVRAGRSPAAPKGRAHPCAPKPPGPSSAPWRL